MKTGLRVSRLSPTRSFSALCNWIESGGRCPETAEVVFESGLGYCRRHADAVRANREWLRWFFEDRQLARQGEAAASLETSHAPLRSKGGCHVALDRNAPRRR